MVLGVGKLVDWIPRDVVLFQSEVGRVGGDEERMRERERGGQ